MFDSDADCLVIAVAAGLVTSSANMSNDQQVHLSSSSRVWITGLCCV